jgi:hypothetical protein
VNGLTDYPQTAWNTPPTDRWVALCNQLHDYSPAPPRLHVANIERKWEMVSAYRVLPASLRRRVGGSDHAGEVRAASVAR